MKYGEWNEMNGFKVELNCELLIWNQIENGPFHEALITSASWKDSF